MKIPGWLERIIGAEAAPAQPAGPDLAELGATGTPIFSGFLRDAGEYNTAFQGGPFSSFRTCEQMRRGSAQVAATVMATKLPTLTAGWAIPEPVNASPIEKEATVFARSCLLEEIDFDAVVRNALLMLDFGCAAHEDCWYVDGNRIRLRKLAARMPLTFYRWICKPGTDELAALGQLGYRGDQYVQTEVPIDKLALFTYQQEGANYAGVPLLRAMYEPWFYKTNLYKVDAIAIERNGMGIPWIEMGPDAKKEDRAAANEWLQKLTVHEKASILLPPGWKFGLKGVEGSTRDPKESIAHHNLEISMAGLAMFMNLGQTQSGARALGETLSDFFALSVQATANQIARVITLTTLKRLIDFNFTGIQNYPKIVPTEILSVKFETVVAALKDLAAQSVNVLQPDDELESWLRKKMGAPEAGEPRKRPQPPAPQEIPPMKTAKTPEQTARMAEGGQLQLSRPPRGAEKFLALSEIVSALDKGRDDVSAALRQARSRVQAEIVNKLVNAPVRDMHRVSIAPDQKLVAAIEGILQGVCEFGTQQVTDERTRQRAGEASPDAATIRAAEGSRKRDPLGVYADAAVSEYQNNLTARAANVALDYTRRPGDKTKGEIIRSIEEDLDGQSDKWLDGVASKAANEAFADGRADGYEQYKNEIGSVLYSAVLDWNTCGNCEAADGAEGATPDEIPDVPNPDCDGGDRCRCVHVYVFSDERRTN